LAFEEEKKVILVIYIEISDAASIGIWPTLKFYNRKFFRILVNSGLSGKILKIFKFSNSGLSGKILKIFKFS